MNIQALLQLLAQQNGGQMQGLLGGNLNQLKSMAAIDDKPVDGFGGGSGGENGVLGGMQGLMGILGHQQQTQTPQMPNPQFMQWLQQFHQRTPGINPYGFQQLGGR